MSQREFKHTVGTSTAGKARGFSIFCACCLEQSFFPEIKGGVRLPSIAAQQYFQRKGWVVGANHRKDLCPGCAKARKEKPVNDVIAMKAQAPREMGREERRLIMYQLEECYGKDAYKPGWTDQKIAAHLNVPRAWVEEVRKQCFGEAGSNPAFDDYLERARKISDEIKAFEAKCAEVKALHTELDTWRVKISQQCDEMWRVGKKLEREIGR